MWNYLKTVQGLVTGTLVALAAIVGGTMQVVSWVGTHVVMAEDFKPWQIKLLGVQRELAEQKRSGLRRERFQIQNDLELQNRKPTKSERERLQELEDEIPRAQKLIDDIDRQIKEAPKS